MPTPFDFADPPADPPPGASHPRTWRLAATVFHAHRPSGCRCGHPAHTRCVRCFDPWPCACRLLAERALVWVLAVSRRSNPDGSVSGAGHA
jgi:hypothetical protein